MGAPGSCVSPPCSKLNAASATTRVRLGLCSTVTSSFRPGRGSRDTTSAGRPGTAGHGPGVTGSATSMARSGRLAARDAGASSLLPGNAPRHSPAQRWCIVFGASTNFTEPRVLTSSTSSSVAANGEMSSKSSTLAGLCPPKIPRFTGDDTGDDTDEGPGFLFKTTIVMRTGIAQVMNRILASTVYSPGPRHFSSWTTVRLPLCCSAAMAGLLLDQVGFVVFVICNSR
mmetsp:Transcript_4221/g.10554  ORF Transcript_4221/g.10554 Transcript_4221/m.10554 type:complete len:228 (+) Transcript_4221:912-1595(+)